MEIAEMSNFSNNGLIRYVRERYPFRVFLPVATCLALASFPGGNAPRWFEFAVRLIAGTLLVFQFRLWDDLGDQPYDRVHHPDRVLSGATKIAVFGMVTAAAGVANLALLLLSGRAVMSFLILNAAAIVWYWAVPIAWRRSIGGRHVTLLKYPAFVWMLRGATQPGPALLISLTAIFLCFSIYELIHDGEMRSRVAARRLMALEVCLLGSVAVAALRVFWNGGML